MKPTFWMRRVSVVALIALAAAACASREAATRPAYTRDVITWEEIENHDARISTLQLIQRLRPNWLQGRGQTSLRSSNPVIIYVNGQRASSSDTLERYALADVREIRFLDSITATQRFGTGHVNGAIMLTLR